MNSTNLNDNRAKARDRFGCVLDDLSDNRAITGGNINFYRKNCESHQSSQVLCPPCGEGFLIGISLASGHCRRIFRGRHASDYAFEQNAIYVRRSSDDYKADLSGSFDFVLLEISTTSLARIAEEADLRTEELSCVLAHSDPTLGALVNALYAPMSGKLEHSLLFKDQLSVAIGTHIVNTYGMVSSGRSSSQQGLARRDELNVKELLMGRIRGDVSIAELAAECCLSRTAFLKAFRLTTGRTPHQWLMLQKIEIARNLLRGTDKSLAEISETCGFSGPSHFSRAFLLATGASPSHWRKREFFRP